MNLQNLINLKPGAVVKYKSRPAKILWTESVKEQVCVESGEIKYAHHSAAAFICDGDAKTSEYGVGNPAITFRSMWPRPEEVEIDDITL